jgi:ribonuclease inhibitor
MKKRCELDWARLHSADAVYDALQAQLGLPGHFGRNLDALWDVLTTDLPGPLEIELKNASSGTPALQPFIARLAALLRDAAQQRSDLRLIEH